MSKIRENNSNIENLVNANGKKVLKPSSQQNQRQPLGIYTHKEGNQKLFVAPNAKLAKTEEVLLRTQTSSQGSHFSIGHAVPYQQNEVVIYEDIEEVPNTAGHESMDVIDEGSKIASWAEIRPTHFADNEMEASYEAEYEEETDDRDDMDDYYEDQEEEAVMNSEEKTGADTEMVNIRRRQRAALNEVYANEHMAYSLSEYRRDIYLNMRHSELSLMPRSDYMKKQQDINYNMRSILVDWMVEVADEYKLKRETLFLSVNYLDRFLSLMGIVKTKLQLVGTAALYIASKYEEIYPPSVNEFVLVTDNTYTNKQLLQMEHTMLKTLKFRTSVPTSNFFCLDLLNQLCFNEACCAMSLYLLETTLVLGEEFMKFHPSVLATSSVLVSSFLMNKKVDMGHITAHTNYVFADLIACLDSVVKILNNTRMVANNAVKNKFSANKYFSVSSIVLPQILTVDAMINAVY